MKQQALSLINVFVLAGSLHALQAAGAPQTPAAAPPGTSAEQKKADESQCMKWAKQQAGLSQPESAQQPSAAGQPSAGGQPSAAGQPAAGAAPADKNAAKPADNSAQSSASSTLTGAASQLGGSMGGAANSKAAQLVKDAYAQCLEKKGYKVK